MPNNQPYGARQLDEAAFFEANSLSSPKDDSDGPYRPPGCNQMSYCIYTIARSIRQFDW